MKKRTNKPIRRDELFDIEGFDRATERYDKLSFWEKRYKRTRYMPLNLRGLILETIVALIVVLICVMIINDTAIRERASGTGRPVLANVSPLPTLGPPTPEPTAVPRPTMMPTLAPEEATPIPEPTADPNSDYLPIVNRGATSKKQIAITVDDCFQPYNLQRIMEVATRCNAKITIFPIGANLLNAEMGPIIQDAVFNRGFEIENHTFSHVKLYRLNDAQMAEEVWKQQAALNYVLGVNYKQHFFRFYGGDGETDQRSSLYLKQLGFASIAHWTYSGSDATLEQSIEKLAPGMIYLFHTTDRDTAILEQFIPYAASQGYRLVTMNKMMGYPENTYTDLSTFDRTMPQLQPFAWDYKDYALGDDSRRTYMIQKRLGELGLLGSSAKEGGDWSGYYGQKTEKAVKNYQETMGLPVTGIADRATQESLFGIGG